MHKYHPQGVCTNEIDFEIENGLVKNVHFINGCPGNLEAICKLVEGMPVAEVIEKLRGIVCQNGTSCADQLVVALEAVMNTLFNMTIGELEKFLSKLKKNLDEVEEERMFVLSQTGLHVPGATVKKYEAEVYDLRERIEEAEKALQAKIAEKI